MKKVMYKTNKYLYLAIGTTLLVMLSLSNNALADSTDVVDEINITVPVSCTMSGTGMQSHNAEITNGTSNSAIGETTIKAFCNDNTGFSIYAIGYTDNEDGKNVLTNVTLGSTYDITTGTAISGNDSKWAMKLSTITSPAPTYPIIIAGSTDDNDKVSGDPDYTSFQEVPDDYTKVAYRKAGTDINPSGQNTAEGSTLKTTYQAYISKTQPAGTYSGQVKYTLVHPYDTEAPFACKPSGTTISTVICMQDISSTNKSTILSSMIEDQQYTLRDKRDGKTYTVSKLKDGNIWMTQNLDLDLDSTQTYTNEDTDLGWNELTNTYETASWTPTRSTHTSNDNVWCIGGVINQQYGYCTNYTPESYDPGELFWDGEVVLDYQQPNQISFTGIPQYHLGNYYNWNAAAALNDSSSYPTMAGTNENINQSICPTGWTLPKADNQGTVGSFEYLLEQYGWTQASYKLANNQKGYDAPLYYNLGGEKNASGDLSWIGYQSAYWSSIAFKDSFGSKYSTVLDYEPNNSHYDGDYINPSQGGASRSSGYSVRCVAR